MTKQPPHNHVQWYQLHYNTGIGISAQHNYLIMSQNLRQCNIIPTSIAHQSNNTTVTAGSKRSFIADETKMATKGLLPQSLPV